MKFEQIIVNGTGRYRYVEILEANVHQINLIYRNIIIFIAKGFNNFSQISNDEN